MTNSFDTCIPWLSHTFSLVVWDICLAILSSYLTYIYVGSCMMTIHVECAALACMGTVYPQIILVCGKYLLGKP